MQENVIKRKLRTYTTVHSLFTSLGVTFLGHTVKEDCLEGRHGTLSYRLTQLITATAEVSLASQRSHPKHRGFHTGGEDSTI